MSLLDHRTLLGLTGDVAKSCLVTCQQTIFIGVVPNSDNWGSSLSLPLFLPGPQLEERLVRKCFGATYSTLNPQALPDWVLSFPDGMTQSFPMRVSDAPAVGLTLLCMSQGNASVRGA